MVLLRHCCWTSVVWTAVGQGGKGSEVLELVQARPSTINTSSGKDKLVRCWTSVWLVWNLGLSVWRVDSFYWQVVYVVWVSNFLIPRVFISISCCTVSCTKYRQANVATARPYSCSVIYAVTDCGRLRKRHATVACCFITILFFFALPFKCFSLYVSLSPTDRQPCQNTIEQLKARHVEVSSDHTLKQARENDYRNALILSSGCFCKF